MDSALASTKLLHDEMQDGPASCDDPDLAAEILMQDREIEARVNLMRQRHDDGCNIWTGEFIGKK